MPTTLAPQRRQTTLTIIPDQDYEDFAALPEGTRAQLIDGELIVEGVLPFVSPTARTATLRVISGQTLADLRALPEGTLAQLIDGEIIRSPAPNIWHQRIVTALATALNNFVTARGLGEVLVSPVDVVLSESQSVQPDLVFVARAPRHSGQTRRGGSA